MNEQIVFDKFNEKCNDAIKLKNNLIVVSGINSFGYYYQSDKNFYKIIQTYKPEDKQAKLVYLIEFNDNLLISCFKGKIFEEIENTDIYQVLLGLHKINFNEGEKKLKDENIMKYFEEIKLGYKCFEYKNILSKFSDSILGVGGIHDIYLINIESFTLVKTISISEKYTFDSFYIGDLNVIFICIGYSCGKKIYEQKVTDFCTNQWSYQFIEDSLELNFLSRPKKKSREDDPKCFIF
jgi:hypothetical protein